MEFLAFKQYRRINEIISISMITISFYISSLKLNRCHLMKKYRALHLQNNLEKDIFPRDIKDIKSNDDVKQMTLSYLH